MSDNAAPAGVQRWVETFNNDIPGLAQLYAPEFVANGATMSRDKLLRFENRVLDVAPKRFIEHKRTHVAGDVTTVEGVLRNPDEGEDWKLPFCAVLTWQDGHVISDYTYTEFSRWPGMGG